MQEERAHNDVVPVRNGVADDVMSKERNVRSGRLRPFASELDGMRTLVAAGDTKMDSRSPGLAPESQWHIARTGCQIKHCQSRIAACFGGSVDSRPEDPGAAAEPVNSLECPECSAQFERFGIRPVDQLGLQIPALDGIKKDHRSLRWSGS
jgi:hypothetical protein